MRTKQYPMDGRYATIIDWKENEINVDLANRFKRYFNWTYG